MIITVCGKGGSGKSTVVSFIAKEYAALGNNVLVIDSDESNYGLHQQLGVELPESFTDYFGGKFKVLEMLSNGPQNMPQLFDKKWKISDIPEQYVATREGVHLMTPGKIQSANEACACPFNAVMCQFIPNLDLGDKDIVIMDMEAGIEHFGRGIDNFTDIVLMVIDPSYESIKLSEKVTEICENMGKPVYYVLNKMTENTSLTVRKEINDNSKVCGEFAFSDEVMLDGLNGVELKSGNKTAKKIIEFLESK